MTISALALVAIASLSGNKKSTNWWGRQNAVPLKFDPKPSRGDIFSRFSNFDKSRLEVAGDVISGTLMGPDVPDKRVKFGDLRLNHSREIPPKAV